MDITGKKHDETKLTDYFKYQELTICGDKYLIGVCKEKELRRILLTNLIEYYEENLLKEDIIKRCQELNPILTDCNFEEIVDGLLVNIPKYVISSTFDNIQLENKIEDGFFQFNIILTKSNPEYFHNNLRENFYFSFSELYYRYKCLLNIVNKKDQEIAGYKAQGIKLIKETLITEPFIENIFFTKFKNIKPVDKISTFLDIINFYDTIQDFKFDNNKNKDSIAMKSVSNFDDKFQTNSKDNEKFAKNRISGDLRCAIASKVEKKTKICKQNTNFKFL